MGLFKKKRENKDKAQLEWEMKKKAEAQRKRKFVGEVFFPLLLAQKKSITHIKNFCKILENDITQTYHEAMKNPLSSLNLEKKFEGQEDAAVQEYRKIISAFGDMPIGEALELISGMPNAIDAAVNQTSHDWPIADFTWGDGNLIVNKK